jgi:hypothetical protein
MGGRRSRKQYQAFDALALYGMLMIWVFNFIDDKTHDVDHVQKDLGLHTRRNLESGERGLSLQILKDLRPSCLTAFPPMQVR